MTPASPVLGVLLALGVVVAGGAIVAAGYAATRAAIRVDQRRRELLEELRRSRT